MTGLNGPTRVGSNPVRLVVGVLGPAARLSGLLGIRNGDVKVLCVGPPAGVVVTVSVGVCVVVAVTDPSHSDPRVLPGPVTVIRCYGRQPGRKDCRKGWNGKE